ncbi:CD48 antigen [Echinops telfairi]|uniref:CD48 antigen n=1 Tax=Echinops telfairi TaxID=9371 RepID=A0AC55DRR5_ECHTE|nr:CD48 antigen [Echinops telfairi]
MFPRDWECFPALQLLFCLLLETSIQAPSDLANEINVIAGHNVNLSGTMLVPGRYTSFAWIYATDQKIIEWYGNNETKRFESKLQDRVRLDDHGTLFINKVQKNDSSTYTLQVLWIGGEEQEWAIQLQVYDRVSKPTITVEVEKSENSTCQVKLFCETQDQPVNYTWHGDSGPLPQDKALEITHTPETYSRSYTCQVSNPVSSKNDTAYFTSPCILARSFGVHGSATWLLAMVPVVLSFLLA